MKKLLAALVCLCMILPLALCSCSVFDFSKYTYEDLGDSYAFTGIGDSTDTEIVIPETYKGKPVTAIAARAFYTDYMTEFLTGVEYPKITSITLPSTITSIGKEAFANNNDLATLVIPSSVTSIGAGAFYACHSLTSLTIPEGVTEIKDSTFAGCMGLTSMTIPSTVTSIAPNAFDSCTGLKSITLPEGITEISASCFVDCKSLETFDFTNITAVGDYAFEGCTALTELTIPDTVETLGDYVFQDTSEELVVNVCFDSEMPEGWSEKWYSGMSGKVMNTSEVYMANVVAPNLIKAAAIQAQIDACHESYEALNEEIGRLNEASKPYQASGNSDMIRYYRDQINACKESQRSYLNRISELKEELAKCPTTGQIN